MKNVSRNLCAIILGAFFIGATITPNLVSASIQHSNILKNVGMSVTLNDSYRYLANHQDKITGGLFEEGDTAPQALQTAWGAMAFAAGGYNASTVGSPSLIDNIANQACSFISATDIERTILALSANQYGYSQLPCDLGKKLNDATDVVTGQIGPDIMSTIFGVLAQKAVGLTTYDTTVNYITAQQHPDGGWDSGWGEESQVTSQAILALIAAGADKNSKAMIKAKQYVKSMQTDTGGIKYDSSMWTTSSDAISDSYALQAIYTLDEDPLSSFWKNNNLSILDDIAALRQSDGSYNESTDPTYGRLTPVWTTSRVLISLNKQYLPISTSSLIPYNPADDDTTPPPAKKPKKPEVTPAPVAQPADIATPQQPQEEQVTASDAVAKTQSVESPMTNQDESVPIDSTATTDTISSIQSTSSQSPQTQMPINLTILIIITGIGAVGGFILSRSLWIKFLPIILIICLPIFAYAANRAGVVARHADGLTKRSCVEFNEDSISGYNLLKRAGLNPIAENGFIVEIGGDRAKSSTDPGVKDDYWSYWHFHDGSWLYSKAGATYTKIKNGDVDGWQRGGSDLSLSSTSFDDTCPPAPKASAAVNDNTNTATATSSSSETATTLAQSSDNSTDNPKQIAQESGSTGTSDSISSSTSTDPNRVDNQPATRNYNLYYFAAILLGLIVGGIASFIIRKKRS